MLPASEEGHKYMYILTLVDYASRYILRLETEATLLKTTETETFVEALMGN